LSIAVPLLLWNFGSRSGDASATVLITVTVVLAGARFAWILGSRDRHLHEMVVWLFVYVYLGLAPFVQIRTNFPGTTPGMTDEFAFEAAAISLLGEVAIIIGSWAAARWRIGRVVPAARLAPVISNRRVYPLACVTLGLAVVYIALVGPQNLFAARSDLAAARADSIGGSVFGPLLSAGVKMGLLVAFISLIHLWRFKGSLGERRPVLMTFVVGVALAACVNPISSARYVFGTVLLAALGALGVYATVNRFRVASVGALLGLLFAFPLLDTFRRSLDAQIELESATDSLATGDFDAFAQLMNTAQYVADRGVTWGNQILGVVLFWVPRDLWAGKPIDTGAFLAEYKGYQFENLSAPLWAEFFINFAWVGVLVGMVLFGFLVRRLDIRAETALRGGRTPGILGSVIPFYLLIVMRGSLLQAMTNLIAILLAVAFVVWNGRERGNAEVDRSSTGPDRSAKSRSTGSAGR
jgi:hypothetical protein